MRAFMIMFLVGLVGCAKPQPDNEFLFKPVSKQKRVMDSMNVRWEIQENVDAYCIQAAKKDPVDWMSRKFGSEIKGCSIWKVREGTCLIITGGMTSHAILGHEIRHCFEGHFHR